jgi:hypothetical protein
MQKTRPGEKMKGRISQRERNALVKAATRSVPLLILPLPPAFVSLWYPFDADEISSVSKEGVVTTELRG